VTQQERDILFKFINKNKLNSLTSTVTLINTVGVKRLINNMVTKENK